MQPDQVRDEDRSAGTEPASATSEEWAQQGPRQSRVPWVPLGFALSTAALPFILPTYYVATLVVAFAIAAVGLNLLWGQAGLMSFGQGIFFGFGAYGSAWVMMHLQWGLLLALLTSIVLGAVVAACVGFLSVRRRGVYFVLLTFAFAQMFAFLVFVFPTITGGENGLLGVPRAPISIAGSTLVTYESQVGMYLLASVVLVLVALFVWFVIRSRFGAALRAIRDNEDRARALGYNVSRFKILAFTLSGGVTGVAGLMYALLSQSVPDSTMQLQTSVDILVMTIVGGSGNLYGAFLGSLGISVLSDQLSYIWPRWRIILGILLILLVLTLKGGIWGGVQWLASWLRRRVGRPST